MLYRCCAAIDIVGVEPEEYISEFRTEDEAYMFARDRALYMLDEYGVESYSLDEAAVERFDKFYDELDWKRQEAVHDFINEQNEQYIEYWVEPVELDKWKRK